MIPSAATVARCVARADDAELVQLLRAGCEAVLAEIDRRHGPALQAHARRLLSGSAHDPEDAVQDTLVRAWAVLRTQDADARLAPWLHTVLRNRSIDLLRSAAGRDVALDDRLAPAQRDAADEVLSREAMQEVTAAIGALPDRQREALIRRAWAGESHAEIARELHTTPAAAKVLVHRARAHLRSTGGA